MTASGSIVTGSYRKLSDAQIRELRRLKQSSFTLSQLAQRFNVDPSFVSLVVHGLRRRAAGGPLTVGRCKKLSDARIREMRHLKRSGFSHSELARQFNIDQSTVSRIVRGLLHASAGGPIWKGSQ